MKRSIRLLIPLCACFALGPEYDVTFLAAEDAGSCLYHCEGSTCADFSNHSSMCVELRAKCQARCSGRKWWGAIAYSKKDKAYGWSSGLNDREAAKKEAMQKCVQNGGKGCEWWAIYENECGAVAIDLPKKRRASKGFAGMPESRRQELHDSSLGMLDYVASGASRQPRHIPSTLRSSLRRNDSLKRPPNQIRPSSPRTRGPVALVRRFFGLNS
jgi:hypothetical protein